MQARGLIGAVNDFAQGLGIHGGLARVGGERNGRLVNGLAVHHGIAAREVFSDSTQVDFRKHHLSP